MPTLISLPAFQLYAICSSILILSLYGLGFFTAKLRNDRKLVVNHEDVIMNGNAKLVDTEHSDVLRVKRAHLNALENAVPFFVIGFIYTQTNPSLLMVQILFFTFVAARLLHAFFYVIARQPFRTLMFALGTIVNITMVVQVIRALI